MSYGIIAIQSTHPKYECNIIFDRVDMNNIEWF